jgi:predicted RND superfamily exporter protein
MVRGFGLLLVIGIAIAFFVTLTAGSAALVLSDREGGPLGASLRGAGELVREVLAPIRQLARRVPRPRSPGTRLLGAATRHPGRLLAVGVALAALGWIADTQTSVQSDVTKLVPSSMPALRDLHTLEDVTGVSGEIDVTVRAANVATPQVVRWMVGYEQALLRHYGYLETTGCAPGSHATLCPALSLSDLFSGATGSGTGSSAQTASEIDALLAAVPSYFSQAVITPDHREAALAFGIRLMPLSQQQRVIDYMRSQLHPPRGVTARLAGLPVLAAEANSALSSSSRRLLTLLAGLIAVGLVLLAVFRQAERALVPLIPIALATGWSALILFVIGIPLNPMSATLGALVIAISTEFSVLLSERFRQERSAGCEPPDALTRAYRSTGAAVLASGITAIAGFGVLVFSDISMLRDFGFVTLVDLSVSLGGVLLVLPAVLALSGREDPLMSAPARGLSRRADPLRARVRRRRARVA